MLSDGKVVGFVMTSDAARARTFYEGVLGLRVTGEDDFALVLESSGTMIRVSKTKEVTPAPHTVLGWQIDDIAAKVAGLRERGVTFERYGFLKQDDAGIWAAPGGAQIAWFKDPDGNLLSLTQFE
jgi:catechol 2,3-dioxygenase-like lactoylglutathione lyase family enzyme